MAHGRSGGLERMDTATTLPDVGLECHLFMQQVAGQMDDVEGREKSETMVMDWVKKLFQWYPDGSWAQQVDPILSPYVLGLIPVVEEQDYLEFKLQSARETHASRIAGHQKAYDTMMAKLESMVAAKNEDEAALGKRRAALNDWLTEKCRTSQELVEQAQRDINENKVKLRSHLTKLIDVIQHNECQDHPEHTEKAEDDPSMMEIEELMNGLIVSSPVKESQSTVAMGDQPISQHQEYDSSLPLPPDVSQPRDDATQPRDAEMTQEPAGEAKVEKVGLRKIHIHRLMLKCSN